MHESQSRFTIPKILQRHHYYAFSSSRQRCRLFAASAAAVAAARWRPQQNSQVDRPRTAVPLRVSRREKPVGALDNFDDTLT